MKNTKVEKSKRCENVKSNTGDFIKKVLLATWALRDR